jgi:hypothetical protein
MAIQTPQGSQAHADWIDNTLIPGDKGSFDKALARRIKMHEFLATGGVVIEIAGGITTYGPAIDITDLAAEYALLNYDDEADKITARHLVTCPWHGYPCSAWFEIIEGRGYGATDGPTLRELRERTPDEIKESIKSDEIERLLNQHPGMSRDSARRAVESQDEFDRTQRERRTQFDSRTSPQDRFPENRRKPMDYQKKHTPLSSSNPKGGGFPWDRDKKTSTTSGAGRHDRRFDAPEDARDTAMNELSDAADSLGDVIEIDGEEDE